MFLKQKSLFNCFVVFLLILSMVSPAVATTVEPRASDYLASYSAYVYPAGWGKVQVWFSVDGVDYMDEIGSLSIQIYESKDQETWTWVETFLHDDWAGMLGYNNHYHNVSYIILQQLKDIALCLVKSHCCLLIVALLQC